MNPLGRQMVEFLPVFPQVMGQQLMHLAVMPKCGTDTCRAYQLQNANTDPHTSFRGMTNVFPKIGAMIC